ncbi:MAG TPA: DUF721 domain-containing protein [Rhodothermales bacterium]|nr:DUF721 domain-containing protein [Bacteroidota bacterium]HRK73804.1 DUF721 domain-containing protein [Rhodothermales bacterium]HRR08210.1 DUF721 domain-containing protein [Rhodothermales bacterium]
MSGNKPQKLGLVLSSLIDKWGMRERMETAKVIETWATLAGPQINGVTDAVWLKDKRLFVRIISSAWRQELYMRRKEWLQRLNEELEGGTVEEIIFR